jgi:hypothetical protein
MEQQCSGPGDALGLFRDQFEAVAGARRAGNLGTWKSGDLTSARAAPGRQVSSFPLRPRGGPEGRRRAGLPRRPLELGPHAPGVAARGGLAGRAWRSPWPPPARSSGPPGSDFAELARFPANALMRHVPSSDHARCNISRPGKRQARRSHAAASPLGGMTVPPTPLVDRVREFLQVLVRGSARDLKTNEPLCRAVRGVTVRLLLCSRSPIRALRRRRHCLAPFCHPHRRMIASGCERCPYSIAR